MDALVLFDEAFEADADADTELQAAPVPTLTDAEISGCRLILRQLDFEMVPLGSGTATATGFTAHFHCGVGAWFNHAEILMRFRRPANARILSIAPVIASAEELRHYELRLAGEAGIELVPFYAGGAAEQKVSWQTRPEVMRATGEGTARVRWTFRSLSEHDPLPQAATLALVIEGEGPFEVELEANARLVRKNLSGQLARARDLITGPQLDRLAKRRFTFPLAQPASRKRFFARAATGST